MGAGRPQEGTAPALDIEEVDDISHVVHALVERLADVHREGELAMTVEKLAAHCAAELAGQERCRRSVAAGEQAADVVQRAEGEGEGGQLFQGGGAGLRLRQQQ
eukprot:4236204-Pleurochrysis_carterae.AAC.1